jgi:hypothetical protein
MARRRLPSARREAAPVVMVGSRAGRVGGRSKAGSAVGSRAELHGTAAAPVLASSVPAKLEVACRGVGGGREKHPRRGSNYLRRCRRGCASSAGVCLLLGNENLLFPFLIPDAEGERCWSRSQSTPSAASRSQISDTRPSSSSSWRQ